MDITINEDALIGMHGLLGDQFKDTVIFCCSEFERLENELKAALNVDQKEAIRHAHSLKSNAAQFGAVSLSNAAKAIELALIENDSDFVAANMETLSVQVSVSKARLLQWLENQPAL